MNTTITKITIGRLYNLGNYEHVRYELTAEVPPGQSAQTAAAGIENILELLDPKRPSGVYDRATLEGLEAEVRRYESIPAHEYEERHQRHDYGYSQPQAEKVKELQANYDKALKRSQAWTARRIKALRLLDDLGGAAVHKDAKNNWDDDGVEFF